MSNYHTDNSASNNGNAFISRREMRASNNTGILPSLTTSTLNVEHLTPSVSSDFEQMVQSLHDLFEHDRQVASQTDSTRCGICYLHFSLTELHYRDAEGFYVCAGCNSSLGDHRLPMIHRQQKL